MNLNNNNNVFSKLSSLVQSGFLSFSRFINHITCTVRVVNIFCGFSSFCRAFDNLYGWRTDTGHAAKTLKSAIFMFIVFKRMHCSELFSYMQKSQDDFRFPEFVHCILETVVMTVKSFTSNNSYVVGNLVISGVDLQEIMIMLKGKAEAEDNEFFLNIFNGSGLETIFMHDRVRPAFYKLLIHDCSYFIIGSETLDSIDRNNTLVVFITRAFSEIEHCTSNYGRSRLGMSVQKYVQGSSKHLSIYRFAQVESNDLTYCYQVNVKSLDGLSENMLKLFVSFLFIFRPSFSCVANIISGYEPFGFSGINESIHWEMYLGCQRVKPTPKKSNSFKVFEKKQENNGDQNDLDDKFSFTDIHFIGQATNNNNISSIVHLLSENKLINNGLRPIIFVLSG
jgi:hypothetical protein